MSQRLQISIEPYKKIVIHEVLEIAFNNIQRSNRHNSGFALRFTRIVRLRSDKLVTEIDTLDRVRQIFASQQQSSRESPGS